MDNKPQLYQVDYWDAVESLGEVASLNSQYGPESIYRRQVGAVEIFLTTPPRTDFYLWFKASTFGQSRPLGSNRWYMEIRDFCWHASESGGASFALYIPISVFEQLVEVSTQPKDEQFMVSQLRQMLAKKPINPGSS